MTCNSYKGQSSYYCEKIELEEGKKNCVLYNNKCSEYYKDCSSITGSANEDVCNLTFLEKIININAFIKMDNIQKC